MCVWCELESVCKSIFLDFLDLFLSILQGENGGILVILGERRVLFFSIGYIKVERGVVSSIEWSWLKGEWMVDELGRKLWWIEKKIEGKKKFDRKKKNTLKRVVCT